MKTVIEMAREAAGDDWGLFQEYMPEIHRLVELVRADERARMAEQPAQRKPLELDEYDAGFLNDFGGGNVEWWWDYIRYELGRAHDFYQEQVEAAHGIKENT